MFCFCFVPKGGANEHPYVSIFIVNEIYSSKKDSENRVPLTHFSPNFKDFSNISFFQLERIAPNRPKLVKHGSNSKLVSGK